MAKEETKLDFIRLRVTRDQKELFKQVANIKGITLTELLLADTEIRVAKELEYLKNKEQLEQRSENINVKLQILKNKLFNK